MPLEQRLGLISQIETARSCRLITYIQSDRGVRVGPGASTLFQMAGDLPRRLIDHLSSIGHVEKIGLFIYSRGGDVSVPWILDNTIRKYCDQFEVIVPYRAHSAATMVTLGADTIVMGKHAELGPIDPTMNIVEVNQEDPTKSKATTIAVEDITSFIKLAKEGMGLQDQAELGKAFNHLEDKVLPVALGTISRQQSYIRRVAGKLLELRKGAEASTTESVVESLITQSFFHQHAITREEAKKDFCLVNIVIPDDSLETQLWNLYLSYEDEMGLGSTIRVEDLFQPADPDERRVSGVKGIMLESTGLESQYVGDLVVNRIRRPLPTVNLNLNLGMPPAVPGGAQPQIDQTTIQQLQVLIQQVVQEELRRQSPVTNYTAKFERDAWQTRQPSPQQ